MSRSRSRSFYAAMASLTYTLLAAVWYLLAHMLASRLLEVSTTQASQLIGLGIWLTGTWAMGYMLAAHWASSEDQLADFSRSYRRKYIALAQIIGVYCAETLLWFSASGFGATFWHSGSTGWVWFMGLLTGGSSLALIGLATAYHRTVWPRGPRPAD